MRDVNEDRIAKLEQRVADLEAKMAKLPVDLPKNRDFLSGVRRGNHEAAKRMG